MPMISPPGSFAGPCPGPCQHLCCEHDRWLADAPCAYCGRPIGYEQCFDVSLPRGERSGTEPIVIVHRLCSLACVGNLTGEPFPVVGGTA